MKNVLFTASNNTTVCLLGSSHARKMSENLNAYMANHTTLGDGGGQIRVVYHDVRMPSFITGQLVTQLVETRGCEAFVISVGQWPAGKRFKINHFAPMMFSQYYQEIKNMLHRLDDESTNIPYNNIPIFLRSINYNPLGSMIGDCPPTDWRSPLVIDGYNSVMQTALQEIMMELSQSQPETESESVPLSSSSSSSNHHPRRHRVFQYIDTNDLVSPVWDAASDWCHLDQDVAVLQGLMVLSQVLQQQQQ